MTGEYLLGDELLDGVLRDVGVGGADHEGDGDLAGGFVLLPATRTRMHSERAVLLRRLVVPKQRILVLRDDGRVGDGRVGDEQSLELGRRHLHGRKDRQAATALRKPEAKR